MKQLFLDLETHLISAEDPLPKPVCVTWATDSDDDRMDIVGNNLTNSLIMPTPNGQTTTLLNSFSDSPPYYTNLYRALFHFFSLAITYNIPIIWHNGFNFDVPVIWHHFPELRPQLQKILDRGLFGDTLLREKLFHMSTVGYVKPKGYSLETLAREHLGRDLSKYKSGEDIWRLRFNELDGQDARKYPAQARYYNLNIDATNLRDLWEAQERVRAKSGFGSMNTEALQFKSGVVYKLMEVYGITLDPHKLENFEQETLKRKVPIIDLLKEHELITVTKSGGLRKEDKKFREYLYTNFYDYVTLTPPTKTRPNGQIAISEDALEEFPPDPVIDARKELAFYETATTKYIPKFKAANCKMHPKYDILKKSGRVGSFIHTIPRDGGYREIIVPSCTELAFFDVDYGQLEARAAAHTCYTLFGSSKLHDLLNSGEEPIDFHAYLASMWEAEVNKCDVNYEEFMLRLSRSDKNAKFYRKAIKEFDLSLFGMLGKERAHWIAKSHGVNLTRAESDAMYDFCYEQFPELHQVRDWVKEQMWSGNYERAYAYEADGRYLNNCTFCSCANGKFMQSTPANGMKEALYRVYMLGQTKSFMPIINLHDQIVAEGLRNDALGLHLMAREMCFGMHQYLPSVRISVEGAEMDYWTKDETVYRNRFTMWCEPSGQIYYKKHGETAIWNF